MDKVEHSSHKSWCDIGKSSFFAAQRGEIVAQTKHSNVIISPSYGGSLLEFDYKSKAFNVSNVISRKEESYHGNIKDAALLRKDKNDGSPKSIHDINAIKDSSILEKLFYDRYQKFSFMDHFFNKDVPSDGINNISDFDILDPAHPYNLDSHSITEGKKNYDIKMSCSVNLGGNTLDIRKTYRLNCKEPLVTAYYTFTNTGSNQLNLRFGVEFNLTLLAANDSNRFYQLKDEERINLGANLLKKDVKALSMVDNYYKFKIDIESKTPWEVLLRPLETVTQSESGFELTYQGSTALFLRDISLKPGGEAAHELSLYINDI